MPVLTFPFGPLEANAYLLHNGRDAVVADPPTIRPVCSTSSATII